MIPWIYHSCDDGDPCDGDSVGPWKAYLVSNQSSEYACLSPVAIPLTPKVPVAAPAAAEAEESDVVSVEKREATAEVKSTVPVVNLKFQQ